MKTILAVCAVLISTISANASVADPSDDSSLIEDHCTDNVNWYAAACCGSKDLTDTDNDEQYLVHVCCPHSNINFYIRTDTDTNKDDDSKIEFATSCGTGGDNAAMDGGSNGGGSGNNGGDSGGGGFGGNGGGGGGGGGPPNHPPSPPNPPAPPVTPIPNTFWLFVVGLLFLGFLLRRQRA